MPHVVEQLSPGVATRESVCCNERAPAIQRRSCMLQQRPSAAKKKNTRGLCDHESIGDNAFALKELIVHDSI